ncbi:hypothetical protein R1sor_020407 [Riccia sorocarpa]|uniref:Uncharacterized protein n=1 Tax=Riccia sorocarpa TaxID=122646 RepID=A0ABD3IIZ8_9MARC
MFATAVPYDEMDFILGLVIDAGLHEKNLLVHSWDIDYSPIAKNQMREIMLRVAWKSGSGELGKSTDLGIVYTAYADYDKLNVGVEDRKARKVYQLVLNLASLDQKLIPRTDPKVTMSAHGFMVNKKSTIHQWVHALRGMRETLLTKGISESNVWKIAWACNKLGVQQDHIGTVTSKHLFQQGPVNWEEWVQERLYAMKSKSSSKASTQSKVVKSNIASDLSSLPSTSQSDTALHLAAELVMTLGMADPEDDFPSGPLMLDSSQRALLAPTQKSKSKRKQVAPVDIRENVALHEDETKEVNIDPKDEKHIAAEAELRDHIRGKGLFMVISGAHSTRAIKLIVKSVMKNSSSPFFDRAKQLKTRLCRILRGDIPKKELVKISFICNLQNKTIGKHMDISFVDLARHGWEQYEANGRPERTERVKNEEFDVKEKELLFKVDTKYTGDLMSLQEHAESLKAEDATVKKIISFYKDRNKATEITKEVLAGEFNLDFEALSKLTALLKLKRTARATSSKRGSKKEPNVKRVKGEDGVSEDRTFENRLQFIWISTRGSAGEKTANPWFIAPFKEDMAYDDNELPRLRNVSLVFVDLARYLQFEMTKQVIEAILLTALGTTNMSPVLFVFVVLPGEATQMCLEVAKSGLAGWDIDIEWGTCEFLDKTQVPKGSWHLQYDASILYLLFKNLDHDNNGGDWSSAVNVKGDTKVELSFHVDSTKDYDLHTIRSRSKHEETQEEKDERLRNEKELQLLSLAPCFTDDESKGSLVNELVKKEAGVDISTQPVILAAEEQEADFDDMMDPEEAFKRKCGIVNRASNSSNLRIPFIHLMSAAGTGGLIDGVRPQPGNIVETEAEKFTASHLVPRQSSQGSDGKAAPEDGPAHAVEEGSSGAERNVQSSAASGPKSSVIRRLSAEFSPGKAYSRDMPTKAIIQSTVEETLDITGAEENMTASEAVLIREVVSFEAPCVETVSCERGSTGPANQSAILLTAPVTPESGLDAAGDSEVAVTRLESTSEKGSSPDDDAEYKYGLQAGAFTKTFTRKFIRYWPDHEPAPIGSRSEYPCVTFHDLPIGMGDASTELSASLTELNIQIDEFGSMDPLVITPTTITTVDTSRPPIPTLAEPVISSTVQGQQKHPSRQPSGSNPPRKESDKELRVSKLQQKQHVRRAPTGQGLAPRQPQQGVRSRIVTRKEKK